MIHLNKYAWYGSAVLVATVMALTLMAQTAFAASTLSAATAPEGGSVNVLVSGVTGSTNEVQTVTADAAATAGTYTLSYNGATTTALNHDASAATIQAALVALSTIGAGGATVADVGGVDNGLAEATGFTVTLLRDGNAPMISVASSLTGPTTVSVAETTPGLSGTQPISMSIDAGSTGTANFAANSGQSLSLLDNNAADTNKLNGAITVKVNALTAGAVVVHVTQGGVVTDLGFTVTSPVASITVTAAATTINSTAGTTDVITATVKNADGTDAADGTSITFTTTLGTLTGGAQVAPATTSNGIATTTLTAQGVSGTAVIAATATGTTVSGSVSVVLAGSAASVTLALDTSTPGASGSVIATATVKDSGGNNVGGQNVSFTVSPTTTISPTSANALTGTSGTTAGKASATFTLASAPAGKAYTVTAKVGTTLTATATFTVGAASTAITTLEVTAGDVAALSTQTIEVMAKDKDGNPAQDGVSITVVVTGGALATPTATTKNGVAKFTYVAPGTAQTVNATAVLGTVTGSTTFAVGGTTTPPPSGGAFEGEIAASGVSLVQFVGGGTLADLEAAAEAENAVSVWTTSGGELVGFIPGAPPFVNAGLGLGAAFPGALPDPLLVIVVK